MNIIQRSIAGALFRSHRLAGVAGTGYRTAEDGELHRNDRQLESRRGHALTDQCFQMGNRDRARRATGRAAPTRVIADWVPRSRRLQRSAISGTADTLGTLCRYAHRVPQPDGGERIILLTDRPLGSWGREAWKPSGQAAAPAYSFTLVELRLNKHGRGNGKLDLGLPGLGREDVDAGLDAFLEHHVGAELLTHARGEDDASLVVQRVPVLAEEQPIALHIAPASRSGASAPDAHRSSQVLQVAPPYSTPLPGQYRETDESAGRTPVRVSGPVSSCGARAA